MVEELLSKLSQGVPRWAQWLGLIAAIIGVSNFLIRTVENFIPPRVNVLEVHPVKVVSERPGHGSVGEEVDIGISFIVKPYYLVSWSAHPVDEGAPLKIWPNEEHYIRFTFVEPVASWWGDHRISNISSYVGFEGEKKPKYVTDRCYARFFLKDIPATGGIPRHYVLRDEIYDGTVKMSLRLGSQSVRVPPKRIRGLRGVEKDTWNTESPQELLATFLDRL